MSLFLTDQERELVREHRQRAPLNGFYSALLNRAQRRAASPGLTNLRTTTEWWHHAAEYVTDAAMAYALEPSDNLARWVHDVTLSIVRRSEDDWVGPWFRNHNLTPHIGYLETAHLCLAVAAALDLAPSVFSDDECDEITTVLEERGIPLCVGWLDYAERLNNWRCVLTFGLAVPAALLNDEGMMERAVEEFQFCTQAFQPDGSYGESLQYSNYAAFGLMLTYEALVRRDPSLKEALPMEPYAKSVRWATYSYLYSKPLSGWGQYPRPRSANFNDCAAMYRPSGDVLLHVAARGGEALATEAGLARWLFDTLYLPAPGQGPFDLASFGLVNHFGFLTLPLLPQARQPVSPEEADLPTVAAFSNGDSIARDDWHGRTILAVHGGGDALNAPGHLHGDLNSFILVHNRERLLLDPGHSCYRNLMRNLDTTSKAHNTCTFSVEPIVKDLRQEDASRLRILEQDRGARREIKDGKLGPPVDRGGCHLLTEREGPVVAIASEAAGLYGPPIERFTRLWFLLGSHALFIVDRIMAAEPVRTTWNWLLNNRDDNLELRVMNQHQLLVRRGDAGMKLFHLGDGALDGPVYAYVHDAYHPLPNQRGEGKPGSGLLMRWQEREPRTTRNVVHAIAVDRYGSIVGWHLRRSGGQIQLRGAGGNPTWALEIGQAPLTFTITEAAGEAAYQVLTNEQGEWVLQQALKTENR